MILVQRRDEAISSNAHENLLTKLESLSEQFLMTKVYNIESASDGNCAMPELRLRQTEPIRSLAIENLGVKHSCLCLISPIFRIPPSAQPAK